MLCRAAFETHLVTQQSKWETFEAISAKWCAEGCEVGALFVEWYVPIPLLCINNDEEFSSVELAYHLINVFEL